MHHPKVNLSSLVGKLIGLKLSCENYCLVIEKCGSVTARVVHVLPYNGSVLSPMLRRALAT